MVIISNSNLGDGKNSLDHYNNCLSTIDKIGEPLHSMTHETLIQRSHYELKSNLKMILKMQLKKQRAYK